PDAWRCDDDLARRVDDHSARRSDDDPARCVDDDLTAGGDGDALSEWRAAVGDGLHASRRRAGVAAGDQGDQEGCERDPRGHRAPSDAAGDTRTRRAANPASPPAASHSALTAYPA